MLMWNKENTIQKTTWKVNLNIELDKRRSITGFAALREKGNTSQGDSFYLEEAD